MADRPGSRLVSDLPPLPEGAVPDQTAPRGRYWRRGWSGQAEPDARFVNGQPHNEAARILVLSDALSRYEIALARVRSIVDDAAGDPSGFNVLGLSARLNAALDVAHCADPVGATARSLDDR